MVTENPKVIVLIPTLNEAAHIATVIAELIDGGTSDATILVADGGSTDGTQDIVESLIPNHPQLRLLHNPGRTQAAAINMLLAPEFATFDILIRADAHASYPPRFINDLIKSMSDKEVASVVIPMDAVARSGCFQKGNAWIADSKLGAGGSPHRGGVRSAYVDHGHHAAFTMDSFRQTGGYDVSFRANEDVEYDFRLTQNGHRIWLDSNIRISYFPRATPRSLMKQYFGYGFGRAQTCLKHGIVPKPRQMIPVFHVVLFALSLLILPFSALGLLWPLSYMLIVVGAGIVSAIHHRSICGLLGAPALAMMHGAWGLGFLTRLSKGRPQNLTLGETA